MTCRKCPNFGYAHPGWYSILCQYFVLIDLKSNIWIHEIDIIFLFILKTPTNYGEIIWEDEAKNFEEHDNKVESEVGALIVELVEGLKKKNGKLKLKLIA
jgi:hypothetical protein